MDTLKESLTFLHVEELKEIALKLALSDKGAKGTLILRILHFLETGQKLTLPKFPEISCAKRGVTYPIEKKALMLKGAYKNDLKTRNFFKSIIGDHFHFTAFGIDWLNEQWMKGQPPTYEAYAEMWQKQIGMPRAPKQEWAYINFLQKHPKESWEKERQRHKKIVYEQLNLGDSPKFCA